MRFLLSALIVLAIPAALTAQEATAAADAVPAEVQLQQSVTSDVADQTPTTAELAADRDVETAEGSAEGAAVVQDPGSRSWWYIVGAVVVGGLILALLL